MADNRNTCITAVCMRFAVFNNGVRWHFMVILFYWQHSIGQYFLSLNWLLKTIVLFRNGLDFFFIVKFTVSLNIITVGIGKKDINIMGFNELNWMNRSSYILDLHNTPIAYENPSFFCIKWGVKTIKVCFRDGLLGMLLLKYCCNMRSSRAISNIILVFSLPYTKDWPTQAMRIALHICQQIYPLFNYIFIKRLVLSILPTSKL